MDRTRPPRHAQTLMYYTRTVWSRRARCGVLGACMAAMAAAPTATLDARQDLPAAIAPLASGRVARIERVSSPGAPDLEVKFFLKSDTDASRLVDVTTQALRVFTEWFGGLSVKSLAVIDAPWHAASIGTAYPGAIVASSRWLAIDRDGAADRQLITALAREYWLGVIASQFPAFEEGVANYSAARAIEDVLQGRQFWSRRYFGGFVPAAIRSVPLSPPRSQLRGRPLWFDELRADAASLRVTRALQTLDRYIGWPAMQQGLATFRQRYQHGGGTPDGLLGILNEQGGRDLSRVFAAIFASPAPIDYGIEALTTASIDGRHHVDLSLRRFGGGEFASGIPVLIRLADGSEIRERWDGQLASPRFSYVARADAAYAEVDPDAMLLLDEDRSNNVRWLRPATVPRELTRGVASWVVWLQDLMLAYTAWS